MEGKKINKFYVIKYKGKNNNGCAVWECKCECGNIKIIPGTSLRNGHIKSCGCLKLCPNENEYKEKIKKRLLKYSKKQGDCLIWHGNGQPGRYGLINYRGKNISTHRAAWLVWKGEIPIELCVCHNCPGGDNKKCINPDHLWLGSYSENAKDAIKKGKKILKGNEIGNSFLNEEDILDIRYKYINNISTIENLSNEYNTEKRYIRQIIQRKVWKHLLDYDINLMSKYSIDELKEIIENKNKFWSNFGIKTAIRALKGRCD